MRATTIIVLVLLCGARTGFAETFYLDPVNGSMGNLGDAAAPWSTLEDVVAADFIESRMWSPLPYDPATSRLVVKNPYSPVHAGDTLILLSGLHGTLFLQSYNNAADIVIMAGAGQTPILRRVHLQACMHWKLIGLRVSSEPYGAYDQGNLVYFESHGWQGPCSFIVMESCEVYSTETPWTSAEEWVSHAASGILVKALSVMIRGNLVRNIDMGIQVLGNYCTARDNTVANFSGDGMRLLGSWNLFEGNTIKNCYDVDDNHDDGIQSYTTGGLIVDHNIVRGNIILNYEDPAQPLRGPLQGIGCFDGFYNDWLVENNLIVVDHWHGITFMGARDCRIINNTVLDPTPLVTPGPSWISVGDSKGGEKSTGCMVKNNVANQFIVDGDTSHNFVLKTPSAYDENFVNLRKWNFHLRPTSPLIDAADAESSPAVDLDGTPRPQGIGPDIGCYEFRFISGVEVPAPEMQIEVYPNPASSEIVVSRSAASHTSYILTDLLGRVVASGMLDAPLNRIPVHRLQPGTYFLRAGDRSFRILLQ